jgi:uncharacterized protein
MPYGTPILTLAAALTLALPPLAVTPAQAASFSCEHALLPAEQAICGNANLSRLDEQTAGMYFLIVGSAPQSTVTQVKAAQSTFLTRRNTCGSDIDCLVDAYTDQMMYLKNEKSNLGL